MTAQTLMADRPISGRDFDISQPPRDYFQDPAPYFRALRDEDPLHRNSDGSILLTRFGDVRTVWRDLSGTVEKEEFFRRRFGEGVLLEHFTTSMLFRDPPDHDRLRALLNPFFTRASLERLRPRIEEIVDGLIAEVQEKRQVDFVADFAFKLPTSVICLTIGFPLEDGPYVHDLGQAMLTALNQNADAEAMRAANAAAVEFKRYVLENVARVRAEPELDPTRDMLSALVAAERAGQEITENEIIHSGIVIFNGGHGTTMHPLAATLYYLTEFPDLLRDLKRNPDLTESAIEEFIRFVTPVQLHWRRTTTSLEIPSGTLAPGTEIVLCAGSANRDETAFPDPDRIDLTRRPNQHIAFGAGVHFCIGRALSRLEMATALPRLLARFEKFERTAPAVFKPLPKFRALESLHVDLS